MATPAKSTSTRKRERKGLTITIKDGQMSIDSIGFVGTECAEDTMSRALKAIGNVTDFKRKKTDARPVHDTNVIDVGI